MLFFLERVFLERSGVECLTQHAEGLVVCLPVSSIKLIGCC